MKNGISLGLMLASTVALADDGAFYVGAGGGGTNFDSRTVTVDLSPAGPAAVDAAFDDSDGNVRAYAGYRLNPNFAVEAVFSDLGEFEINDDVNGYDATYETSSLDVAAVGILPLWEGRIDLFARAGLAFWSGDSEITAQSGVSLEPAFVTRPPSSGQDLFWSVGININPFEDRRWTFRSELSQYEVSEFDKLETLGFNIQYRF